MLEILITVKDFYRKNWAGLTLDRSSVHHMTNTKLTRPMPKIICRKLEYREKIHTDTVLTMVTTASLCRSSPTIIHIKTQLKETFNIYNLAFLS